MGKWANLWLRPLPGTDIAWINGLIRLLIEKGGRFEGICRIEDRRVRSLPVFS